MPKRLLGVLVLLSNFVANINVYADAPKIWIQNDACFFSRDVITNGKVTLEPGALGGYDLEDLVSDNPKSLELAHSYSRNYTYAMVTLFAGFVPSLILTGVGASISDSTLYYSSLVAAVGTLFFTFHFHSQMRHYLYKSVNEYNGIKKHEKANSGYMQVDSQMFSANLISFKF